MWAVVASGHEAELFEDVAEFVMLTAIPPFARLLFLNSLQAMNRVIIAITPAPSPIRGHFCEFTNEKIA